MADLTTNLGEAFAPNVQHFDAAQVVPEALIMQTSTFTVPIEGDRPVVNVPYVDVDDDAGFVPEGAPIPEADATTSSIAIATGKVAVLDKVSREEYEQDGIANLLATSFSRAVVKKANVAYLAQPAPASPAITPPAGLLNLAPTDGGAVSANLDAVIDAVAGVETSFGKASHIIANPTAWASILKLKAGTGSNQSLVGVGISDVDRALLSVPVLTTAAMPADTLLVVDSASILSTYGQVMVATSEHAYFGSDSIGLRVTWRFGARIVDTDRVVKLTITEG